ncbi:hypothetical protein AC579_1134 [Pseudocercospora musae]|uniref:Uncharacterized protein n=1 Tax=Pseudocercospora musae TaxID=113226 RepID=A0A139GTM1_9PEZI|nr:hypothetical protein AC579_1134 [Pseudocercospora musae]
MVATPPSHGDHSGNSAASPNTSTSDARQMVASPPKYGDHSGNSAQSSTATFDAHHMVASPPSHGYHSSNSARPSPATFDAHHMVASPPKYGDHSGNSAQSSTATFDAHHMVASPPSHGYHSGNSARPSTATFDAHHMVASPSHGEYSGNSASPNTSTSYGGALDNPVGSHSIQPTAAVKPPLRSSLLDEDPEGSLTDTLAGWNLGPVETPVKQEEHTIAASPLEEQRLRENLSRHIPPDQVEDILRLRREGILRSPSRLDQMVPSAPAAHRQQPYLASIDAALYACHQPDHGPQSAQPVFKQEQAPGASSQHSPSSRQVHPTTSTQTTHAQASRQSHGFGHGLQYAYSVPIQDQVRANPPPQTHTAPALVANSTTLQGLQQLHSGPQFTHSSPTQEQVVRPRLSQTHPLPAQTAGTSTSQDLQQLHYGSQFNQAAHNQEQFVQPNSSQTHPPPTPPAGTSTSQDLLPLHHGTQSAYPMSNPELAARCSAPATANSHQVHTVSTQAASDAALPDVVHELSFGMQSAHAGFVPHHAADSHMASTTDHLPVQKLQSIPATTAHANDHMAMPPLHLQVQNPKSAPATTAHAENHIIITPNYSQVQNLKSIPAPAHGPVSQEAFLVEPAQSISPPSLSELSPAQSGAKEEMSQQSDMPSMRAYAQAASPTSVQVPAAGVPPLDFTPRYMSPIHGLGQGGTRIPHASDGPNMTHGFEFRSPDSTLHTFPPPLIISQRRCARALPLDEKELIYYHSTSV